MSKRLGTVEIRALDPIPDAERLLAILRACVAVAQYPETMPFDRERYNKERPSWSEQGLTTWVRGLWEEMQAIATLPLELLESTESDVLARLAEQDSPEAAYRRLDSLWRKGTGVDLELAPHSRLRSFTGVLGYYVPQLPWMAFKGFKEWYGHTPDATRSLNGKLK